MPFSSHQIRLVHSVVVCCYPTLFPYFLLICYPYIKFWLHFLNLFIYTDLEKQLNGCNHYMRSNISIYVSIIIISSSVCCIICGSLGCASDSMHINRMSLLFHTPYVASSCIAWKVSRIAAMNAFPIITPRVHVRSGVLQKAKN